MKRLRLESIFLSRVEGNIFFSIFLTFFLGTTCLPSQEGRRFFTFKRIGMSTYYFNKTTTSHFLYGCPGAGLYSGGGGGGGGGGMNLRCLDYALKKENIP